MSTDREKQAGANTAGQSELIKALGCRSVPMTDNEKLARWQGIAVYDGIPNDYTLPFIDKQAWLMTHTDKPFSWRPAPDYRNEDSAAMSLLDTLVEKGCHPEIFYSAGHKWNCTIFSHYKNSCGAAQHCYDGGIVSDTRGPTRREAVVAAVLKLIVDKL